MLAANDAPIRNRRLGPVRLFPSSNAFRRAPTMGCTSPMALGSWHGCVAGEAQGDSTVRTR